MMGELQCNIGLCDQCEFPLTVPLQSLNGKQMSAALTVQRDCERVLVFLVNRASLSDLLRPDNDRQHTGNQKPNTTVLKQFNYYWE